jgi:hypothetical protein
MGLADGAGLAERDRGEGRAVAPPKPSHHIGGVPVDIAAAHGSLWVLACTERCAGDARHARGEVIRVDAASGRVRWRTPVSNPHALTIGAGGVWVIDFWDSTVQRIDMTTGRVRATIRLKLPRSLVRGDDAFLPGHITTGQGAVWVTTARGYVARINPSHNRVSATIRVALDSAGPTLVTDSTVWVAESLGVRRVDTSTGRAELVTVERAGRSFAPGSFALESESLWVSGLWVRGRSFSDDDEPALVEIPRASRAARAVVHSQATPLWLGRERVRSGSQPTIGRFCTSSIRARRKSPAPVGSRTRGRSWPSQDGMSGSSRATEGCDACADRVGDQRTQHQPPSAGNAPRPVPPGSN